MKLDQYWRALDLVRAGVSAKTIQQEAGISLSEAEMMLDGALIAPYILLQQKDTYERCPQCGSLTLLPCYTCFLKSKKYIDCVEVIVRPVRNQKLPLNVLLDTQLLEIGDDDDDETFSTDD